jgi:hypothetical protein
MAFAAAVVVVCDSEEDRRAFVGVLPDGLRANKVISVRTRAEESQRGWGWEGPLGIPTLSAPPSNSDKLGVAVPLTSRTELDVVVRLASTKEWILCTPLWPWPSDVLVPDEGYVLDRLR